MQKLDITKVVATIVLDTGVGQLTFNIALGSKPQTMQEVANKLGVKLLDVAGRALGASFVDRTGEIEEQANKIAALEAELADAKKAPEPAPAPKKSKKPDSDY